MAEEGHLTGEQLACLARGDTLAAERDSALAHLRDCEACGDRLAAILLLRQVRPRRAFALRKAAVAAVLALVAVALYLQSPWVREPRVEPPSPERRALIDRWAQFGSRTNVPARLYDFTMSVLYPDVVPVSPDQHLRRTRAALIDLRDNRYDEAIEQLVQLHREYPDFDSIAGWLGVAMHLSGETDPLVGELLERGLRAEITLLRESSLWYGAHHLLLTGEPERAIPKLQELASVDDSMGRMARSFLDDLPLQELDLDEPMRNPRTEPTSLRHRTCRRPVGAREASLRAA